MRSIILLWMALTSTVSAAAIKKAEVCGDKTFQCSDGQCVPSAWRCDGDSDCADGEDEKDCVSSDDSCSDDEYMCRPSADLSPLEQSRSGALFGQHCIPAQWKCDGEFDCAGKDDEEGCTVQCHRSMPVNHFICDLTDRTHSCIPWRWLCDGQADCADRSDEVSCSDEYKVLERTKFRCGDGQFIHKTWRCDGDTDCPDQSDELDCPSVRKVHNITCASDEFKCNISSKYACINREWVCDGDVDCPDGSDEQDCTSVQTVHNISCASDEFKCKTSEQCINKEWVCDGDFDCPDRSDEAGCDEVPCKEDEMRCRSGACRPKSDFGNGVRDCEDGSDEPWSGEHTELRF